MAEFGRSLAKATWKEVRARGIVFTQCLEAIALSHLQGPWKFVNVHVESFSSDCKGNSGLIVDVPRSQTIGYESPLQ